MIVVDTNILAYLYLPGPHANACQRLLQHDSEWAAPSLWRSEFCNTLLLYLRKKLISRKYCAEAISAATALIGRHSFTPNANEVIELAMASDCTAYDCEFIAVARSLATILVTEDKALLRAFPKDAMTMAKALARR